MNTPWTLRAAALFAVYLLHVPAMADQANEEKGAKRAVGAVATVWGFPEYAAACMKIDAMVKKSSADLQLLGEFEKYLGWVGPALGLTDAALAAYQGRDIEAVQKVGEVGADTLVCAHAPHVCPAWAVGRTIGGVINAAVSMTRADKKDLTGVLEDLYLSVNVDAPASARELVRLEAALAAVKARRRAIARASTCEDPAQTRNGVDELLRSIAPPAVRQGPQTKRPHGCEELQDTARSEALAAKDPGAYDALLARCL